MRMLLIRACNPSLSLHHCMQNWAAIAAKLREAPRKRQYQCEAELA